VQIRQKTVSSINEPARFVSEAKLPSPDVRRWVPRRKAEVVLAVKHGLLTADEACRRYNLTREELASWESAYRRSGVAGLRATHYSGEKP
jgi:hypothetical protein